MNTAHALGPKASAASLRDPSSELVKILDDYLAAIHAGSPPSKEQLLASYPHLAKELEACLASLEFLAQASPPLSKGGQGG